MFINVLSQPMLKTTITKAIKQNWPYNMQPHIALFALIANEERDKTLKMMPKKIGYLYL